MQGVTRQVARAAQKATSKDVGWNTPREGYAIVSDTSAIGCVGTLHVATRGKDGAGEVVVTVRGSKEALLAWSDEPLPKGSKVLVVEVRGPRTVVVEPWTDAGSTAPDLTTDIP